MLQVIYCIFLAHVHVKPYWPTLPPSVTVLISQCEWRLQSRIIKSECSVSMCTLIMIVFLALLCILCCNEY